MEMHIWFLVSQFNTDQDPVPKFIEPVFAKTSATRSFSTTKNERFGLVFVKTGSINSGTDLKHWRSKHPERNHDIKKRTLTHLYSGFSRVLYWRATTEPPSGAIPASSLSTIVPLLLAGSSSCSPCSSLSPSIGSRTPLIKSAVSEVSSRTPSRSAGKSAAARLAAPSRGCPAAAAMSAAESVRRHLRGLVASVIVASADRRFSCLKKKKYILWKSKMIWTPERLEHGCSSKRTGAFWVRKY